MGEIQGEVFACSLDWEGFLDVDALLSQAAVAVKTLFLQSVAAPEGVALSSVLAQVRQLQEVFLVQPNVVQAQAVSVGGSLWLSTYGLEKRQGHTRGGRG